MGKHKADIDRAISISQEPQFGVPIPGLPLTELCDFALVTQPLCASVSLSLK